MAAGLTLVPSASAAVKFEVDPQLPTPTVAGATDLPASLEFHNTSTGFEAGGPVVVSAISLAPACGSPALPCEPADVGPFALSATGTGALGTSCAGTTFAISGPDGNGAYRFNGPRLELHSPPDVCRIEFTLDVVHAPVDIDRNTPRAQTWAVGEVSGFSWPTNAFGVSDGMQIVAVDRVVPAISTVASPGVEFGGEVHDTATLAAGDAPSGEITFDLYGPGDADCSRDPVFTDTKAVSGNGEYQSSSHQPAAPGTYRWIASYSGDQSNDHAAGACNDPNESVTVGKASPALVTAASAPIALGGEITDTATLSGGHEPGGEISFELYGPDDSDCSGDPIFTDTKPVSQGAGDYVSAPFTPVAPGTYRWVASYSGDAANEPVAGACNDAGESVAVGKATPALATAASGHVKLGGEITDTATLSGGHEPGGQITFDLYGPDDADCSGASVFTDTKPVDQGAGDYVSAPFEPTAPGTYSWIASYSGDANNEAVAGACNDAGESVTIAKPDPPETQITKRPRKLIRTRKAGVRVRFAFKSPEPNVTFLCTRDGGAPKPCSSPRRFRVGRGRHTFTVAAVDSTGDADPTPARFSFRVARKGKR